VLALAVLLSIVASASVSFVMRKLGGGNPTNDNIRVFVENKKKRKSRECSRSAGSD
jgi:hypothetical protein